MTSQQLANWRHAHNLTQPQLAALLDTPLKTYRNWEQGVRRVPGVLAVALQSVEHRLEKR